MNSDLEGPLSARSGSSALYNSRLHLTDSESSRSERENRLDEEENHRRVEPYGSTRHLDGTPLNDSRRSKDRPPLPAMMRFNISGCAAAPDLFKQ